MIVLGIETSTPRSTIALGSDQDVMAQTLLSGSGSQEALIPALQHLVRWTGIELSRVGGVAVGLGPGLFTGLRVGVETGKSLAQVLTVPIVGLNSLDALAFGARYARRPIAAVIDARRGEVFSAFYRALPGGVVRESDYMVGPPERIVAEIEALGSDVLMVGNGAILYRREFDQLGSQVEFGSSALAYPLASALVELSIPRFLREEFDRLFEVVPFYLRKSDAEIAWDQRTRGA